MHITNLGVPWKFASGAKNLILQALKFSVDVYLPHIPRQDRHKSL
jgi:hypothetical protein